MMSRWRKIRIYVGGLLILKIKMDFFQDDLIKSIGAGIYAISVVKNGKSKVLYIGESVFIIVRCASHLYELKKHPEYLGFTDETIGDLCIKLKFRVIEEIDDTMRRKAREKELIKNEKPLSQNGMSDQQKSVEEKIRALTEFLNNE